MLARRLFIILAILMAFTAAGSLPAAAQLDNVITVTLDIPPYTVTTSGGVDRIAIEGYRVFSAPGDPQVPARLVDVALPPDVAPETVTLTVTEATYQTLPGVYNVPPAPPAAISQDDATTIEWGLNAAAIVDGRNTATYGQTAFYPADWASTLVTAQMRKWQVARLLVTPVQVNPVTGEARAASRVTIQLTFERLPRGPEMAAALNDTLMDSRATAFVNHEEAQAWYAGPAPLAANVLPGYAIITTNNIVANSAKLSAFISHKQAEGFNVITVTETQYGSLSGQAPNGRAEKVRQWLKNRYVADNIEYVLLIGNPDPDEPGISDNVGDMPMKMMYPRWEQTDYRESATDFFYADLTGNWNKDGDAYFGEYYGDSGSGGVDYMAEVYVGRIPVYSGVSGWVGKLDSILRKTIDYETTTAGTAWRRKALLPMAFSDVNTDGAYMSERMKSDYLNSRGYASYTLYEQGADGFNSVFASNEELVWPAVSNHWQNNSYGIVAWWTHGWWGGASKIIDYQEAEYLNDARPALTFQVSCNNGEPEVSDNLGYALLKQGAIGTVSASRVSWYAIGQWQPYYGCGDNATLGYRYMDWVSTDHAAGEALYRTMSEMGACWDGTSWMNFDDFNLYGDPAIKLSAQGDPPTDWTSANIGAALNGSTSATGSSITIRETGGDIWGTADGLRYVYKSGSGDVTFQAKLTAWLPAGVTTAKAGLMIRGSTDPGAPEMTVHVTGVNRALKLKYRTQAGWSTANFNGPTGSTLPLWLRLTKSGSTVTAYYSTNGTSWTQLGSPQMLTGIGGGFLYGMAVSSNSNTEVSATFEVSDSATPTITSFSPTSGAPNTLVTINGTNLSGATTVKFNGTSASFNVVSATKVQATVPAGATTGKITIATPNGVATSPTDFVVPGEGLAEVYLSAAGNGTVAGLAFTGGDILHYVRASNSWEMLFDASDVGLAGNVSAFSFMPDGSILLTFTASVNVPGVGAVTPMDVVRFTPTSLGNVTAGSFAWYFDGSDVGLAAASEKIDSLSFFQTTAGSRRLRISTVGVAKVTGDTGATVTAQDEDILLFIIENPGSVTTGRWSATLHLDGSVIPGMAVEDVNGYGHDGATDARYVIIVGAFNVGGVTGDGKSIIKLMPDGAGNHTVSPVTWLASGATFPSTLDGLELFR